MLLLCLPLDLLDFFEDLLDLVGVALALAVADDCVSPARGVAFTGGAAPPLLPRLVPVALAWPGTLPALPLADSIMKARPFERRSLGVGTLELAAEDTSALLA